ncbi:MAG TPA: cytochrome c [Verrucomicrobiales bacterium]|nr:cytochrome c [Verrucomicrobiales bacterium]
MREDQDIDYQEGVNVLREHAPVAREKPEPQTGREPLSLWALFLCSFVLVVGGGYLGANHGGFRMDQYTVRGYQPEDKPPDPYEPQSAGEWLPQWLAAGKRVYANCAGCHQGNGMGVGGQYPPLAGSEWVVGGTERLAMIILNGLTGPIQVAGSMYNTEGMQAWKAQLSDREIAQVMTFMRQSWGNDALVSDEAGGIVTEEMVAYARNKHGAKEANHVVGDLQGFDTPLPGAAVDPATGKPLPGGGGPAAAGEAESEGDEAGGL